MEACLHEKSARLVASYLVKLATLSPTIDATRCIAFPGFSARVVKEVCTLLREQRPDAVIKVDSAYKNDLDLPADLFLDSSNERFTTYRNRRQGLTILLPADALDEERESQEAVETRDPEDIRSQIDSMLLLLPDVEVVFGNELEGVQQFLRLVVDVARPSLEEAVRYMLRVYELRKSGEVTKYAMGEALPELGAFRYRDAFRSIQLQQPSPSKWRKVISRIVVAGRDYAFKRDPKGRLLDPEELENNLQAIEAEISDANVKQVLRDFIHAPITDQVARQRAIQLDWKRDKVDVVFSRPRKERIRLGEATLNHLRAHLTSELLESEINLLKEIDLRPDIIEEERDVLLDFYEKYRKDIGTNRALAAKWEKALLPRDLEETDFLLAVAKMAFDLLDRVSDDERGPFRLVVEFDHSVTPMYLLEKTSYTAVRYFATRYRGLSDLLAPNIIIRLDPLERVLQYDQDIADEQKKEHMDPDVVEAFSKFVTEERNTRPKNRLPFLAYLVNAVDGKPVRDTRRSFTWAFPYNTFLAGLNDDLKRHAIDPLRYYKLPRAVASAKGTVPPIAVDEPRCVDTTSERGVGRLVGTAETECVKIRDKVAEGIRYLQGRLITAHDAAKVMKLVEELEALLKDAFGHFLDAGLAWSEWRAFAERYGSILKELLEMNLGERFAHLVLEPLSLAGVAFVGSRERVALVSPLHPLRLISLYVKAHQVKELLVNLLTTDQRAIDEPLFLKALEEDLSHPYYPEILVDQGRLLTGRSTLADYSMFAPANHGAAPGADNNSETDANLAATLLKGIIRDFVLLHPHERGNVRILLHSVKSERFAEVVANQLRSDRELIGVRCNLLLRDESRQRLQTQYRVFVNNLNLKEDPSATDLTFVSRIGVTAVTAPNWTRDTRPGDVDLAFLMDRVSSAAEIRWHEQSLSVEEPIQLADHFPARWSRKHPGDPRQLRTSAYLCCPFNPEPVASYYRVVAACCDPQNNQQETWLPVRQVNYGSSTVAGVLQETHAVAKWVVNYDPLLDRNQLRHLGINVIRYRPSRGERSLIISSAQEPHIVRAHLEKKLRTFGLLPSGTEGSRILDAIIDQANRLSGNLLLTAAGRGCFTNELVGAILSRTLLTLQLPKDLRDRAIFIYLDDYGTLFAHDARLAGDIAQPSKGLADLLCLVPTLEEEALQLKVMVSEAKFLGSSSAIGAEAKRSEAQLLATYRKLHALLGSQPAVDKAAWLNTLANIVIDCGERSPNSTDPEKVAWFLRRGKARFSLEGYSHVFVMEDEPPRWEPVSELDNVWQGILGARETKALLKWMVDEEYPMDLGLLSPRVPENKVLPQHQHSASPMITESDGESTEPALSRAIGGIPSSDDHTTLAQPEATTNFSWAKPEIAALLSSITDPSQCAEDQESLLQELQLVEQKVKSFLPNFGIRVRLGPSSITPNAFRIRVEGQIGVDAAKIERLRDQFKTVTALSLIQVEAEPGYLALSFRRTQRGVVSYLKCLEKRVVTSPGMNTKVLLGQREDNGELLYYDFSGADSHALIGGMSNSGKSQLLGMMILDLLLTNDPKYLQLVLIDPKQVEFPRFRHAPHLHGRPIVRYKNEAMEVLNMLTSEMDRRYGLMGEWEVNDIEKYNAIPGVKALPRIVVIFDEVADWMLDDDFKRAVNDSFQRLAGKARAAGIHLILSTQRPDNTVISPILRANLGAKIALRVDKKSNSEIILGEGGAEHLLGQGHGLARLGGERYLFQSAFVPDEVRDRILEALPNIYAIQGD